VIAGGHASRYGGIPKGLLEVGGRRILDRVVDTLAEAVGSLPSLCANAPDAGSWRPGLAVHLDVVPDIGALGGILTAVETGAPVVCVAWDMPFVPAALVRALAEGLSDADVVIPESGSRRGLEPLCAAYGPACGPAIRSALAQGDRRAIGFHQRVRVARLPAATVLNYGDPGVLFFNVNAPEDLQQAEALCRARDSSR
jgi:molybdopterin-guanine dinucleotide biosynthesis protein A